MTEKASKASKGIMYGVLLFLMFALLIAISAGICIGILWLIFLCFGWEYNPLYGVGLWLIFVLINWFLKDTSKNN